VDVGLPRRLGRYTLLSRLASGGMAEVYLARQEGAEGFEKLVAVKRILASYVEDKDFVTMFLDEGRLAGQLSHPHIVQTFDLGEDRGDYFIAMEYVAGESLSAITRALRAVGQLIDERVAVQLIAQAADALDYAHHKKDLKGEALGIVHRDVSPQNLLVTYEGQLKVLDFGIAKARNRHVRTETGQVKGKFSYMSPEQLGSGEVDGRSDVFALGIVAFELLTGTRLVGGGDTAKSMALISGLGRMPRLSERRPNIDRRLDLIVGRAMERSLSQRYATAADFSRDLRALRAGETEAGAKDAAQLMQRLFRNEIGERQRLIDRAMAGPGPMVESSRISPPAPPTPTAGGPPPAASTAARPPGPSLPPLLILPPPERSATWTRERVLAGLLGLIVVVGLPWVWSNRRSAHDDEQDQTRKSAREQQLQAQVQQLQQQAQERSREAQQLQEHARDEERWRKQAEEQARSLAQTQVQAPAQDPSAASPPPNARPAEAPLGDRGPALTDPARLPPFRQVDPQTQPRRLVTGWGGEDEKALREAVWKGDFETGLREAAALAQSGKELSPQGSYLVGFAHWRRNELEKAAPYLDAARRARFFATGNWPQPGDVLARVYYASAAADVTQGGYEAALPKLVQSVELDPSLADAEKALGVCYASLREPEQGASHYEKYLSIRPDAPDAADVRRILQAYYHSIGK
jgi:serine/threonine protein kinase